MFKVHFSVVLATLFTLPVYSQETQSTLQTVLSNAPTIINLSASHPNTLATPAIKELDASPESDLIRYGRLLIIDTYKQLPNNVNN